LIFAEDFAHDAVGDFPKRLTFVSGNAEVAEWQGRRMLRVADATTFAIPLPETLPKQFTLELDYLGASGNTMRIRLDDAAVNAGRAGVIEIVPHTGSITVSGGAHAEGHPSAPLANTLFPVRLMADADHVKLYMGDTRVANAPNLPLGRSNRILVTVPKRDGGAFIGNIRIAAGGKDLYAALGESGRVTAEGILFDSNSDRLRPESDPVLKQIGDMLAAHPDLRLSIEGHTDDVGAAAANEQLSAKRAAAVKAALVAQYGVDQSRLESRGFGARKPVADNASAAGRAKNRRVELVRQ
jgi:outer membrane protein OmpA-like peptidoglycan-associated protein